MRVADRALLDTNVLLAATDEGRAEHVRAHAAINDWPAAGTVLYTSGQILREYLSVGTRPVAQNGLGLAQPDAVANVRALQARLRFLSETDKVSERLLDLLGEVACHGKQVHDGNLVATMLTHGVDTVVTINVGDFARFNQHIRVIGLDD
jgi:predicted nucleic acid-binding protein